MDLYETYLRTTEGETYHPTDIREGIEQFLGEKGYRISFNIEGVVITLRRDMQVDADMRFIDSQVGGESVNCAVTIRGHTREAE